MQEILIKAASYIAIIVLGYVLRRRGFFGPEAFGVLSKVVIKITLPAAIVASCAGKPIDATMLAISALAWAAVWCICFWAGSSADGEPGERRPFPC